MTDRRRAIEVVDAAPTHLDTPAASDTALAFSYLFIFRRVVVSLALVGAVLAWAYEFPALMWAVLVVGIGELLESSYYISVLRWRQGQARSRTAT
jgi:hypothetical protein